MDRMQTERSDNTVATELTEKFRSRYGDASRVYHAPGRVNLIGEHTDYNDGFVMPAAIGFYTWVAIAPRRDRLLSVYSENFCEGVEVDLDEPNPKPSGHWSDYLRGLAIEIDDLAHGLKGANVLIHGEVPVGSGLSSSAAFEVSMGLALLAESGVEINRTQLVLACQRAENNFVGIRSGIMDQFISCFGKSGHALLLDCRSLEYRLLPLADHVSLVICNTMVKHHLASGEYNARRAECEAGVHHLGRRLPGVRALRDVTNAELEEHGRGLPDKVYRRCRHVIGENARVMEATAALERGDLEGFGRLMAESHRSLRDDYEVSCDELDSMVELANRVDGVYGARMTGGGFGGCTINLVKSESVSEFKRVVAEGYQQITGRVPEIYICTAAEGAEMVAEHRA